jgi:MFS family permease
MTNPVSKHALLFATSVAAMGGFLFGYDTAVINGANELLKEYFDLDAAGLGIATASAIIGCIPGAAIAGTLSDRYGRKRVLYLTAILFGLSAILSALPFTLTQFLLARFIGGVGIGIASMVCPVYIAECSPADKRGRLGTLFQFGIVIGIFVTLFINLFIQNLGDLNWNTQYGWRWMLGAEVIPSMAFLGLIALSPESPRWLVMQGRVEQARNILLRWTSEALASQEINAIQETMKLERGKFSELFEKRFRKPLVAALGLMIIQQFCGINAIIYYSTSIFSASGAAMADAFISGLTRNYPIALRPALETFGVTGQSRKVSGMHIVMTKNGPLFLADTTVNIDYNPEELVDLVLKVHSRVKKFQIEPRIALVTYSNFGSSRGPAPIQMRKAVEMLHQNHPEIIVDGEMQTTYALDGETRMKQYPFNKLGNERANVLVFPGLNSGNAAFQLMRGMGMVDIIGPVLLGFEKTIHILHHTSTVREIVNMVALSVCEAQEKQSSPELW